MKKLLSILTVCLSCFASAQFQGDYAVSNWTLSNVNGNGYIDTSASPNSITLFGTDGLSGLGHTYYTITVSSSVQISFSWNYSTTDGASFDYPNLVVNNGIPALFTGYSKSGSQNQSGTMTVDLNPGDSFSFDMESFDGCCGRASVTISDFLVTAAEIPSLDKNGNITVNLANKVNQNGAIGISGVDKNGKKTN